MSDAMSRDRAVSRPEPLTPERFQQVTGVSRETLDRLTLYAELLRKWQGAINLVSRDSLGDLWRRHFLDSAQLMPLLPAGCRVLVDLGSGAGFPGLVLAALGIPDVHLIESDSRKAVFLRETARQLELSVQVHNSRIEDVPGFPADAVTARALAPLSKLLDLAGPFLAEHSICVFLKGRGVEEELTAARESWKMTVMRHPSASDPSGTLLRLEHLHRERAS